MTGWICPKCNRVYAPSVTECGACNARLPGQTPWPCHITTGETVLMFESLHPVSEWVPVADTISRPSGIARWFADAICRWTGHLLVRSHGGQYTAPGGGQFRTSHCERCWRWGYRQSDYWPTDGGAK